MSKQAFPLIMCLGILMLCPAASALADTFTAYVDCSELYTHEPTEWYWSRTTEVDFGVSFSSIQSLQIYWSGGVSNGWYSYPNPENPESRYYLPIWGEFGAYITAVAEAHVGYMYSAPPIEFGTGLFSSFNLYPGADWSSLLDGRATLGISFSGGGDPGMYSSAGIDSAYLYLEGTPIPEPSSLLALVCCLGGLGSLVRHRRK